MSEKPPQFERPPVRVMGKATKETRDKIAQEIEQRFRDGEIVELPETLIKEIQALEYPKEAYEHDFITSADSIINGIRERYGLETFNVPARNIHIVPPDVYKKTTEKPYRAHHSFNLQLIMADAQQLRESKTAEAKTILHELVHLKGFLSIDTREEPVQDKEPRVSKSYRRIGLMASEGYTKDASGMYHDNFWGLNEAVVSELEQRYGQQVAESSSDPTVKAEIEWLDSEEAQKLIKEYIDSNKLRLTSDDVDWISRDGRVLITKSYISQRRVLRYMVQEIADETGETREEVYDLFFRAYFTGRLLKIARLVERVFGKNAFRAIGMMGDDKKSARSMLDYLFKVRLDKNEKDKNKTIR